MAFTFFMRDQQTIERAAEQMIPYASGRSRIKIPGERALFSGGTPVRIVDSGGVYTAEYLSGFEKLADRQMERIYPGHNEPVLSGAAAMTARSLAYVRASTILIGSEPTEIRHSF